MTQLDGTDLPVGASTPPALWDREADLRNGALDSAYWLALKAAVTSPAAAAPRKYNWSRCGVPTKKAPLPVLLDSVSEALV